MIGQTVDFQCNICGQQNLKVARERIGRDISSCAHCYSNVRFRSIVHAVSTFVFGKSTPLTQFPERKDVRGVGLSDADIYAVPFSNAFDYRNTFFHTEPNLDITAPPEHQWRSCDFVISSDVFEHVEAPVSRAFIGASRMLRPGGALILTVPCGAQPDTREHFGRLHRYKIVEIDGAYVLVNRLPSGVFELYQDLVFHGGPGQTLEMRFFSQSDLIHRLHQAGFVHVQFLSEDVPEYGIYHGNRVDVPMIATVRA